MKHHLLLGLALTISLAAGGCESVRQDVHSSIASTQNLFADFSMDKLLSAPPSQHIAQGAPQQVALSGNDGFSVMPGDNMPESMLAAMDPAAGAQIPVAGDDKIIPVPSARPPQPAIKPQPAAKPQQPAAPKIAAAAPVCPDVRIVSDLNQVHQFAEGAQMESVNLASSIRMQDVEVKCTAGTRTVTVDMTLAFAGQIGPKGRAHASDKPSFAYPYFVAITNDAGSIVAKEVFATTLTYDTVADTGTKIEQVRQIIPAISSDMRNYKVLIGFQLSDRELAYNRSLPPDTDAAAIEPAAGEN
ncbi:MAG: hypothetical protein HYU57_04590 [Micavibrio aeruginosavorus]|nr:hypothetical protein [Micavibrio aeruginosavorus]